MLGKVHLRHGRNAQALPHLEKAAALAPDATSGLGPLAMAYARLGRRAEAEAIERRLVQRAAGSWAPAHARAEVAMALGNLDAAMEWFERSADEGEPWVVYVNVDPFYEPLRRHPRYGALLRRLKLQ
jgi:serine/threonine-protein kinase